MKTKRLLSILLALCMVVSILPANVLGLEVEAQEEAADVMPLSDAVAVAESETGYPVLVLDEVTTAVIPEGEEYAYFSFVPEESGYYSFTSISSSDTYGYLYDADMNQLYSDDDSGSDNNFAIDYYLEAEVQYYFGVRYYGRYSGSFDVQLKKVKTLELESSESMTVPAEETSSIRLAVEESGYYIVRVTTSNATLDYSIDGYYCGAYVARNGYTYHRFYLYAGDNSVMRFSNNSEEDLQLSFLMKAAQEPTSISILGPETGFSNSNSGYYTLYFGSGWAYSPVTWSLEGNGSFNGIWDYQVQCYLEDVGTLTLTATSQTDDTLTASLEIQIIDSIELEAGEVNDVTLPYNVQMRYRFTPEESGLYTVNFGTELENRSLSLYEVTEDGNENYLSSYYDVYALEAGTTYKLIVTNYEDDLTTTLQITSPEELVVEGNSSFVNGDTYRKVFALRVEEDGWYDVRLNGYCNAYIRYYQDGWTSTGTASTYYDENDNFVYHRQAWLEAGRQYLVYVENYNYNDLTVTVVPSTEPTSFYVSGDGATIVAGSEYGCSLQYTPWYAKDEYSVEILSGDAEVTSLGDTYFYIKGNSAGTVEAKVTLDCGLEYTFTLNVVEPVDVVPNTSTSVTVSGYDQGYAELKVEESGYYVLRMNTTDVYQYWFGSGSEYGAYVGKNGYTYYRFYLYSENSMVLHFQNNNEEEVQISLLMKPAETPTSISIVGQESGFSYSRSQKYTLYFGSGWAFCPVYWSVEGNGYIDSSNSYMAWCYLQDPGTLTLTATSQTDDTLTGSFEIEIVDSIELEVGVDNEVTLPYDSQVRYLFAPQESGPYTLSFGADAVNISHSLYQVDADGNESRIYSTSGMYLLDAAYTYKLYVTSYYSELTTTIKLAPLSSNVLQLDTMTEAVVPANGAAWFSFVPEESGYYYLESFADVDTYGHLHDSQLNEIARNDDGGNGTNFLLKYYLEAGVQYYYRARYYSSGTGGSFNIKLSLCPKPTDLSYSINRTVLPVGEYFYIRPEFYPSTSGDSFTITSSDESILAFSYQDGDNYYFDAVSAGKVTVTIETGEGLSQSVEITVVQPVDVELGVTASATAPVNGMAYFNLSVEEHGYYIARFKTTSYNLTGSYNNCGVVVNEENGYTYVRLELYEGESAMLMLYNNTEADVRCHVMMKEAQLPTSISIVGPELGFSNSYTQYYTVDYGSVWAFTPVHWVVEGDSYLNSDWYYRASLRLNQAGQVTLTAISYEDENLTASIDIRVIDDIAVDVGTEQQIELPVSMEMRYSFTVEESGYYQLRFGHENINYYLHELVENGGSYVGSFNGVFYLEEGSEYRLYVTNNHSDETLQTTLSIDRLTAITTDVDVPASYGRHNYSLTVEESGWYLINTKFDASCSVRFGANFEYAPQGQNGGGWTGNNYSYIRTYWLESGTEYLVSIHNNWDDEYTFRAEACPAPQAVYVDVNYDVALVGSAVLCYVNFDPWYSNAEFSAEVLSGDAEITHKEQRSFYVQSETEGTVEVKVTLASGLEETVTIVFMEPEELAADDKITVSLAPNAHSYVHLNVEEEGYYIVRVNDLYAVGAVEGYFADCGETVDAENGYRYHRFWIGTDGITMMTLYNHSDEDLEVELVMKAAQMPESISIEGPEFGFTGEYLTYFIDYGSHWAFAPVSWTVEGAYLADGYEYYVECYLENAGTVNVTAVCRADESVTASIQATALDAIPVTDGQDNEVTLPSEVQMRYSFVATQSGAYSIDFGTELQGYSLKLYRISADGSRTRIYGNNACYELEAGETYWIYVTNRYEAVTTTLNVSPIVFTELILGEHVLTELARNQRAWFSFTPSKTGAYTLVRGTGASVQVFDSANSYYTIGSSYDGYVYYSTYNMEAGHTYYIRMTGYDHGYLDNVMMVVAPEAGNVIPETMHNYNCVVGSSVYVYMNLYPNHSADELTWTVSDETIAVIEIEDSRYVRIRGLAEGTVTVTATTENGTSGSVEVRIMEPVTVDMTDDQVKVVEIQPGTALRLNVTAEDDFVLSLNRWLEMSSGWYYYSADRGEWQYLYVTEVSSEETNEFTFINPYSEVMTVTFMTEPMTKLANLSVNTTDVTLPLMDYTVLNVMRAPFNSWEYIYWHAEDPSIVGLDWWGEQVYVQGRSVGQTVVTGMTESGVTVSFTVTVEAPEISASLKLNEFVSCNANRGAYQFYSFTAPKAGDYFFAAIAEIYGHDAYMYVYDSNWQILDSSDDYSDLNPGVWVTMTKGETIYIGVRGYDMYTDWEYRVIAATTEDVYGEAADLYIERQPRGMTVADGKMATVSVLARGEGLTYEWYYSYNGKFYKTDAFTGPTYSIQMNSSRSGRQVYCVITDASGNSVTTNTVTLGMGTPLQILSQPESVKVDFGQRATVRIEAEGEGLTYTWYYCDRDSDSFYKTEAFKGNTYYVEMTEARAYRRVFCVVSDQYGNAVESYDAVLYPASELQIVRQPVSITTATGTMATVSVVAIGDGLTYEWYYSANGKFYKTDAFTGPTYSIQMNSSRAGRQVYCVVKDAYGNSVKSDVVTLYRGTTFAVTQQPQSVKVVNGETATVKVNATGAGLKYAWYYSDDGGETFHKTTAFTGKTYSIKMTDARAERLVYCVITNYNGCTIKTDVAVLHQLDIKITQHPESVTVANGQSATVKVKATGNDLRYAWYFSDDGGSNFTLTKSFTGNTYSVKMNDDRAGRLVYCVITDADGNMVSTDVVQLRQLPLKIVSQPQNVSAAINAMATVKVEAAGVGLTYEWYYSYNGKFYKTDAFTGPTYSVSMNASRDGRQVYCVITDINGYSVQTDTVTLSMIPIEIVSQPQSVTVADGETATVTVEAKGNDLTYTWYYSYNGKFYKTDAFTGPTYSLPMNSSRDGRQVYCVITDADGNQVTTEVATLNMA